jgi:hypothetical protein
LPADHPPVGFNRRVCQPGSLPLAPIVGHASDGADRCERGDPAPRGLTEAQPPAPFGRQGGLTNVGGNGAAAKKL